MVTLSQLLLVAGAALIFALVPGPAVVFIVTRSVDQSRRAGMASGLGVACGNQALVVAAAFGLSALLATSEIAYDVVRFAGAAYLVYLGVQSLRSVRRGEERLEAPKPVGSPFRQGLVTNLLNPKLAVLFTTLLPQFIAQGDPAAKSALLAAVFLAIGLTWLVIYTLIVGVVARSRRFRVITEAITGVVLIALGARLALER